jgi:hypothetical protein
MPNYNFQCHEIFCYLSTTNHDDHDGGNNNNNMLSIGELKIYF